ncbi:MAG: metallophosphoesterase [Bacillota bacterium]
MRVLAMSDTHGAHQSAAKVVAQCGCDLVLHAGDLYEDARRIAAATGVRVLAVAGNSDGIRAGPRERVFELGGFRTMLVHGHQYDVKQRLDRLVYRGLEIGARLVVFGHTHLPVDFAEQGIRFINPGSLSTRRLRTPHPTYCLLSFSDGTVSSRIVEVR